MPLAPLPLVFKLLDGPLQWVLAVAIPVSILTVWRLWLSPRATWLMADRLRWTLQAVVLLIGPVSILAAGWVAPAVSLACFEVIGAALVRIWEPPAAAYGVPRD